MQKTTVKSFSIINIESKDGGYLVRYSAEYANGEKLNERNSVGGAFVSASVAEKLGTEQHAIYKQIARVIFELIEHYGEDPESSGYEGEVHG